MTDLHFYLSLFRRRVGWFLVVLGVVCALSLGVAITLPPVFATNARLVVESEKIPDELAASTVETQAIEHLEIIQQRVLTRETLLNIAHSLEVFGTNRPDPDSIVRDMRGRISFDIDSGIATRKDPGGATTVRVGFRDSDPVLVASVVNELVTRILAEDVDMRTSVARQTLEFFDQEVSRLEQQLSESGAILLSFQQDNRDFLPDAQDIRARRMVTVQTEMARVEREIEDLTRERRRLVRLHQSVRRQQGELYSDVESYESRQISALRETLEQLPANDPGVDDIKARIAGLEKHLEAQQTNDTRNVRRTAFHDRIDEIDERIRAQEERRLLLLDEVAGFESNLTLAPAKAAQLASLEQDHENLRTLYNQALEAQAMAETGDAIEALSKGQRVAVIEQASVPRIPVSPNRKLVALGGGAVGVLLGLLVVFLLELRLGFLRRPVDLTRHLGITPIATLPNLDTFELMDVTDTPQARGWKKPVMILVAGLVLAALGFASIQLDLIASVSTTISRIFN